jgi:hypothetical protein
VRFGFGKRESITGYQHKTSSDLEQYLGVSEYPQLQLPDRQFLLQLLGDMQLSIITQVEQ